MAEPSEQVSSVSHMPLFSVSLRRRPALSEGSTGSSFCELAPSPCH